MRCINPLDFWQLLQRRFRSSACSEMSRHFSEAGFIACRCRRPVTAAVSSLHSTFFQSGISTPTDPPPARHSLKVPSRPAGDAAFSAARVNHCDARTFWLFGGRARTLMFFINGQSVIITPRDYYLFLQDDGFSETTSGMWFFSPVIISPPVGR